MAYVLSSFTCAGYPKEAEPRAMATLVTATCGNDVVGWSPDGASAQQRVFELQHRARVSGTGWLPKGKALAVAGNDCVVNIYSMPDKKVAATVPKTISLPAHPPVITALALSQATVLYGCSDGSINMAKLPDVKVWSSFLFSSWCSVPSIDSGPSVAYKMLD